MSHIDWWFHVHKSIDIIGSYIVVNPSGQNLADIAFIAPALHANNLLKIGVESEVKCFFILPNMEAYVKSIHILNFLEIDHTLAVHLGPLSRENSLDNTDEPIQNQIKFATFKLPFIKYIFN